MLLSKKTEARITRIDFEIMSMEFSYSYYKGLIKGMKTVGEDLKSYKNLKNVLDNYEKYINWMKKIKNFDITNITLDDIQWFLKELDEITIPDGDDIVFEYKQELFLAKMVLERKDRKYGMIHTKDVKKAEIILDFIFQLNEAKKEDYPFVKNFLVDGKEVYGFLFTKNRLKTTNKMETVKEWCLIIAKETPSESNEYNDDDELIPIEDDEFDAVCIYQNTITGDYFTIGKIYHFRNNKTYSDDRNLEMTFNDKMFLKVVK